MTENLASRTARASKPGYRKQATRTVRGLPLVGFGGGGAWATTDDGFTFAVNEGDGGGWVLFGADPNRGIWCGSLGSAVAFVIRLRALCALHEEAR